MLPVTDTPEQGTRPALAAEPPHLPLWLPGPLPVARQRVPALPVAAGGRGPACRLPLARWGRSGRGPAFGRLAALCLAPCDAHAAAATPAAPRLLFTAAEVPALRTAAETGWRREARGVLERNAANLAAVSALPYRLHGAVTARAAQYQILTLA